METGGDREIPLTRGLVALVDAADFDWLSQWKWSVSGSGKYAERAVVIAARPALRTRTIKMHRLIIGALPGQFVDHANMNGLDNRRANLRACTPMQNSYNRGPRGGVSPFKGVYLHLGRQWRSTIKADGRVRHLGLFATQEEAARAYDAAATVLHGEFARLNFPEAA